MPDDDNDDIGFELAVSEDNTCYTLSIMCRKGIGHEEFAAALISTGNDILEGVFDFGDAIDINTH